MGKDREQIIYVTVREPKHPIEISRVDLQVDETTRQLIFTFDEAGFKALKDQAGDALAEEGAHWEISIK